MKKLLLVTLCALIPFLAIESTAQDDVNKYLAGAVPIKNGIIVFEKEYKVPGKSKAEIFSKLKDYVQEKLIKGENSLEQSRIIESDSVKGVLAASIEENLYFKKKHGSLIIHASSTKSTISSPTKNFRLKCSA